jgi:hypothetical protein
VDDHLHRSGGNNHPAHSRTASCGGGILSNQEFHIWRWRILAAWVISFSLIVGYALHLERDQANRGDQARAALCVFAVNLQNQINSSRQYVDDVRAGIRPPIPGVSANDIAISIHRQQITINSLKSLHCKQFDKKEVAP